MGVWVDETWRHHHSRGVNDFHPSLIDHTNGDNPPVLNCNICLTTGRASSVNNNPTTNHDVEHLVPASFRV